MSYGVIPIEYSIYEINPHMIMLPTCIQTNRQLVEQTISGTDSSPEVVDATIAVDSRMEPTEKKYETQPTKIDRRSLSSPKPWYRYRKKKKVTRVASTSKVAHLRQRILISEAVSRITEPRIGTCPHATKFRVPGWLFS